MSTRTIEVLKQEPDLAAGLTGAARKLAVKRCVARVDRVGQGVWNPRDSQPDPGGFGLLVTSGYVVRRVGQGGRFGAELLGPGDLLRPWQAFEEGSSVRVESVWTAIAPLEFAILDRDFAERAAPFPALATQLVDRTMLRSRYLAIAIAILHQPRIDRRLHMLLWHYADRWGRVGAGGTAIELPLTHRILAELVGARRPTVSTALGSLADEGRVIRQGSRWLLLGDPPVEVETLAAA